MDHRVDRQCFAVGELDAEHFTCSALAGAGLVATFRAGLRIGLWATAGLLFADGAGCFAAATRWWFWCDGIAIPLGVFEVFVGFDEVVNGEVVWSGLRSFSSLSG
jgi:hypothetical protein